MIIRARTMIALTPCSLGRPRMMKLYAVYTVIVCHRLVCTR